MATTIVDLGQVVGPQGPAGEVDPTTPMPFTTPSTDADMASGDPINTLFGKIKKRLSVLLDKIGDLSALTTTAKSNTVAAINEVNNNLVGTSGTIEYGNSWVDGSSPSSKFTRIGNIVTVTGCVKHTDTARSQITFLNLPLPDKNYPVIVTTLGSGATQIGNFYPVNGATSLVVSSTAANTQLCFSFAYRIS